MGLRVNRNISLFQPVFLLSALFLFALVNTSFSQTGSKTPPKKVKFYGSDNLFYDAEILKAKRYIGNVHCEYEGTHFYCDSLYQYDNDDFDAFSNIRIIKGGTFTLVGQKLHFDNLTKTAQMRNSVVLKDKEMTLTTNNLNYNLDTEIGRYFSGGKVISNKNQNTLTSEIGYYHSKVEMFYFRNKVVLKNPDYTVNSDTMQYNSIQEISYFKGPTTILGDKSSIYCENGYYNSKTDLSQFGKNAKIISGKTVLSGDSMNYDGKTGVGRVFENITIRDTTENYTISGRYGYHDENSKLSFVTGDALLTQAFDSDSLFMHADTLKAIPNNSGQDAVYAYHRVKIFKNDLQGKCDSLTYFQSDSTLSMYHQPILWSGLNQITGDTLKITISNGDLKNLLVRSNAFIASDALYAEDSSRVESSGKFNQIKGRNMTGVFEKNELKSIYVEGNGQLIFFQKNDDEKKASPRPIGLNKGMCSNILITIENNELKKLRMEKDADSQFSPMRLANTEKMELENFKWRGDEKPQNKDDIFK